VYYRDKIANYDIFTLVILIDDACVDCIDSTLYNDSGLFVILTFLAVSSFGISLSRLLNALFVMEKIFLPCSQFKK